MPAAVLVASMVTLALLSIWRLQPLHPVQLWAIPWAVASCLFATRLLPFRDPSWTTVALAVGASAAFAIAAIGGDRLFARLSTLSHTGSDSQLIASAALIALALTAVMFAAFLVQASSDHGLKAVLLNSKDLRDAIGAGTMALTIKYVYAAFAATVLCATAAGALSASRKVWVVGAVMAASSTYFSTGRANLVTAVIAGLVAFLLARPRGLSRKQLIAGTLLVGALSLGVFVAGGRLVGKTFENNPSLQAVPSTFTAHREWSVFALPYEYASAPIAALDIQVSAATTWGSAHGCAALSEACRVLHRFGFDVEGVSRIRPFTSEPLQWNTYTALDVPLLDGGLALTVPIVGLIGFLLGSLWSVAGRGWLLGACIYAIFAPAVLTSSGSFNFTAPHLVGAALISLASVGVVRLSRQVPKGKPVSIGER
jgi:hypothetical protein